MLWSCHLVYFLSWLLDKEFHYTPPLNLFFFLRIKEMCTIKAVDERKILCRIWRRNSRNETWGEEEDNNSSRTWTAGQFIFNMPPLYSRLFFHFYIFMFSWKYCLHWLHKLLEELFRIHTQNKAILGSFCCHPCPAKGDFPIRKAITLFASPGCFTLDVNAVWIAV